MKVVHSSLFRAVCAIIIGVLLIQYREQTVTWITIAIGVLFFYLESSLLSHTSALSELQRRCKARCFLMLTANRLSEPPQNSLLSVWAA